MEETRKEVFELLSHFYSVESARKLFNSRLNYEYENAEIPKARLGTAAEPVGDLRIIGSQGDFKIIYCQIDRLLLGAERPIVTRLLRDYPYALTLFSDKA
jgi:hypothetical protein